MPDNRIVGSACISADGRYRYTLRRKWDNKPWFGDSMMQVPKTLVWIMGNPSTADAHLNDPTIRQCIYFTDAFGYTRFVVVNACAYRTADVRELRKIRNPVGPNNYLHITKIVRNARKEGARIIIACGARPRRDHIQSVLDLPGMQKLYCLGVTRGGWPRHPLFMNRDAQLREWNREAAGFSG